MRFSEIPDHLGGKTVGQKIGGRGVSEPEDRSELQNISEILEFCQIPLFSDQPFFHPGGRGPRKTSFLEFSYY